MKSKKTKAEIKLNNHNGDIFVSIAATKQQLAALKVLRDYKTTSENEWDNFCKYLLHNYWPDVKAFLKKQEDLSSCDRFIHRHFGISLADDNLFTIQFHVSFLANELGIQRLMPQLNTELGMKINDVVKV